MRELFELESGTQFYPYAACLLRQQARDRGAWRPVNELCEAGARGERRASA